MIYTAIYMDREGKVVHRRCPADMNRHKAWKSAVALGAPNGECLLALVCGGHPVYTYESFNPNEKPESIKHHDLYEIIP